MSLPCVNLWEDNVAALGRVRFPHTSLQLTSAPDEADRLGRSPVVWVYILGLVYLYWLVIIKVQYISGSLMVAFDLQLCLKNVYKDFLIFLHWQVKEVVLHGTSWKIDLHSNWSLIPLQGKLSF